MFMSDAKVEKPQLKPQAKPSAPAPTQHPDTGSMGLRGGTALPDIMDARRETAEKALHRFSEGTQGTPSLPNLQADRTAPIRAAAARIMRKASGPAMGTPKIPQSGGTSLPSDVRERMEPKLGADLSSVRVHTGGESARSATEYGARAFTVGNDVHFNAGEFNPGSKAGDKLIAHELTHVVQGQKTGIHRKAEESQSEDSAHAAEGPDAEVSHPDDPAEKEADHVADHVADSLHNGADAEAQPKGDSKKKPAKEGHGGAGGGKGAEKAGGKDEKEGGAAAQAPTQAAPQIGAKLSRVVFRAANDPKSVVELVTKLAGKALEAYTQMKQLEQDDAINGICAGSKVKQSDGTLNVPNAQAAFAARWLDAAAFESKKLLKDKAFKKKTDDALSAIKNSCDETDGTSRPGATLGDKTSETALKWESEHGKPWISQDGHYQKIPNYIDTISKAVAVLESIQAKVTEPTKLAEIAAAIKRGRERIAKMQPSIGIWNSRVTSHPSVWKPDGDSKVQPGFPKVK